MPIATHQTEHFNLTVEQRPDVIEQYRLSISEQIEEEFRKNNKDFEKLQTLVSKVIMLMMRGAAKRDSEFISEMGIKSKAQTMQIQSTYNTWPNVIVTWISAGVSVVGGAAGLAPFATFIPVDTAQKLASAATSIGSAGTSISGIGSLLNSSNEGKRTVLQYELKRIEGKEDDRKGAKQNNNQTRKEAKSALDSHLRDIHDIFMKMSGG